MSVALAGRQSLQLCLVILMGLSLLSCASPAYYYQATTGHLKLMRSRQDISSLLENTPGESELAESLQLAQDLLHFAEGNLDLPAGESYRTYVKTGKTAVTWNVVAVPEFSLEAKKWCFPVAGCVPYRGYFERDKAERFADKMRARGLDVAVTPVTAYSTLGWFDDPLLDTMIRGSEIRLAATLFHELAHQKLYIKGDTAFNESYATFMERAGVSAWVRDKGNSDISTAWTHQVQAMTDFNELLADTRRRLASLYQANGPDDRTRESKAEIFAGMTAAYRHMSAEKWAGREYYRSWFHEGLNNARLALFASYEGGVCAFSELFREAGRDMAQFHSLARKYSELPGPERRVWLNQSCPDVASGNDL